MFTIGEPSRELHHEQLFHALAGESKNNLLQGSAGIQGVSRVFRLLPATESENMFRAI